MLMCLALPKCYSWTAVYKCVVKSVINLHFINVFKVPLCQSYTYQVNLTVERLSPVTNPFNLGLLLYHESGVIAGLEKEG